MKKSLSSIFGNALWRRRRPAADGFSLPASGQGDTFYYRPSETQATTSQTRPTLAQLRPAIHVVCFLTRYRSACAEYNLFPIKSDINPLLGAGYYSFWSAERNQRLSEKYFYNLGEAHNAYLETYLNSGLIGLLLLIVMLFFAVKRIKREVLTGSSYGALCLAFLVTVALYAISEAIFNRLNLLWFVTLLVILEYPKDDLGPGIPLPSRDKAECRGEPGSRFRATTR